MNRMAGLVCLVGVLSLSCCEGESRDMLGFGKKSQRRPDGIVFAGEFYSWKRVAQNSLVMGGIGSGKSYSTEPLIEEVVRAGCPLLSTAVKPDEAERYERICKKVGASERFVRVRPGSNYNIDLLDELTRPPYGSPEDAATFLGILSDVAKRGGGKGENEAFWRNMEEGGMANGIRLNMLVNGRVNIPELYETIITSPNDREHGLSAEFNSDIPEWTPERQTNEHSERLPKRRRCARLMVAIDNDPMLCGRADARRAIQYFMSELGGGNDKMRASVLSGINGVIGRWNVEPWIESFSPKKTTLTPEIIERERLIVVLDFPLMQYHMPARTFQSAWVMLTQRYLMRRDASKVNVPFFLVRDEAGWTLSPEWDALAQVVLRSQKAATLSIVQDLDVLESCLGGGMNAKNEAMAFASNHLAMKLFFANDSVSTNKWASAVVGDELQATSSSGSGGGGQDWMSRVLGANDGAGWSESFQPKIRSHEYSALPQGCCVAVSNGRWKILDLRRK